MRRSAYPGFLAPLQHGLASQGTLHGNTARFGGYAHGIHLRGADGGTEKNGLVVFKKALTFYRYKGAEDDRADELTSSQELTHLNYVVCVCVCLCL